MQRSPVAAVEIVRRDLSRLLNTSAKVEPRATIRLASRTSGTVATVSFEEGDRIERGQVLARLDMAEQRAELARAHAKEKQAKQEYLRAAGLREQELISAAEYEIARTHLRVTESERRLWQTRLSYGEIGSPRDAVVAARHVEPGEAVASEQTLFELAVVDELVLRLGVSEMDVVHLRKGQTAPVRLDAMPSLTLEGTIRRIFPTADPSSGLITIEI